MTTFQIERSLAADAGLEDVSVGDTVELVIVARVDQVTEDTLTVAPVDLELASIRTPQAPEEGAEEAPPAPPAGGLTARPTPAPPARGGPPPWTR